jgi:hypothetical protein
MERAPIRVEIGRVIPGLRKGTYSGTAVKAAPPDGTDVHAEVLRGRIPTSADAEGAA